LFDAFDLSMSMLLAGVIGVMGGLILGSRIEEKEQNETAFTVEKLRKLAGEYLPTVGEMGSIGMLDDGSAIDNFLEWIEKEKKGAK